VLPSLPGYGFSGEPTEVGWDPGRVAPQPHLLRRGRRGRLSRRVGRARALRRGDPRGVQVAAVAAVG
jgi:hypothetical protein